MEVLDLYTCQELCQVGVRFGNILGTEMEVPDLYTCQELCQVGHRSYNLWEHSGSRDGGSCSYTYPELCQVEVRFFFINFGNILGTEM